MTVKYDSIKPMKAENNQIRNALIIQTNTLDN
ncbi:MAG: hypothetical protein FD166_1380 [Bacteroidetes bacterium]|nr:MAG: hypothetical protein FD166_1380 [Bacteroidota bacterium]